jgi:hypothetical protein
MWESGGQVSSDVFVVHTVLPLRVLLTLLHHFGMAVKEGN